MPIVRSTLGEIDPSLPTGAFQTLGQIVDRAVSPRRFVVILLGAFAATALVLASLGIYAMVSYSVGQRRREIGIRLALGASRQLVEGGLVTRTLLFSSGGVLTGFVGSLAISRLIDSLLFGVDTLDPTTYLLVMVLLTGVAAVAAWLPARRASRSDPASVLRLV